MNRREFIKNAAGIFVPVAFHILVPSARSQKSPAFLNQSLKYRTAAAAGGASYLLEENCEDTGTPSGWTDSNSPDWDYTGVVLAGSQSFRCNATGTGISSTSPTFTSQTDAWAYCLLRPVSLPSASNVRIFSLNAAGGVRGEVRLDSNGKLDVRQGTDTATTVGAMTAGTTYHVWLHYIKGTGADGYASVAFSTDGVKPTSGNDFREVTAGTSAENVDRLAMGIFSSVTSDLVFDKIRVDDVEIGDNPA